MCFEFGCFGSGRREDYGGERPARKEPQGRGRRGNRGKGADYSTGVASPPALDQLPATAEAEHKAYHDVPRKDHHAPAVAEAAGGHDDTLKKAYDAGYTYGYTGGQGGYNTPRTPARHRKVGDDAGYTYAYTAAGHRDAAMDNHHFPTTTTHTTLAR